MKIALALAPIVFLLSCPALLAEDDESKPSTTEQSARTRMSPEELKYVSNLSRKIKKNWPKIKTDDRKQLTVSFVIEDEGKISVLQVLKSTGSDDMDQSGLDAITQSAPFGAPPESMKLPRKLQFTFVFQKEEKEVKVEAKEDAKESE